jgi:ribonuclease BN (tRNA processing enzyme)
VTNPADPSEAGETLELTLLGTGTLLPDAGRASPAHHLRWRGTSLLLDCGAGTLQALARAGIAWQELTHVLLSHYHTDHTGALAPLLWALTHGRRSPRRRPLAVAGPPGLHALRAGLELAHGAFVSGDRIPVEWHEVPRAGRLAPHLAGTDVALQCHPTPHTGDSVAWRVDTEAGSVGYTGDTGPGPELSAFLAGCDVIVCECATADGEPVQGHLTPSGVAQLARTAEPRRILLTHVYPPHDPTHLAAAAAELAPGVEVLEGRDGMRVRLGPRGALHPPSPSRSLHERNGTVDGG